MNATCYHPLKVFFNILGKPNFWEGFPITTRCIFCTKLDNPTILWTAGELSTHSSPWCLGLIFYFMYPEGELGRHYSRNFPETRIKLSGCLLLLRQLGWGPTTGLNNDLTSKEQEGEGNKTIPPPAIPETYFHKSVGLVIKKTRQDQFRVFKKLKYVKCWLCIYDWTHLVPYDYGSEQPRAPGIDSPGAGGKRCCKWREEAQEEPEWVFSCENKINKWQNNSSMNKMAQYRREDVFSKAGHQHDDVLHFQNLASNQEHDAHGYIPRAWAQVPVSKSDAIMGPGDAGPSWYTTQGLSTKWSSFLPRMILRVPGWFSE